MINEFDKIYFNLLNKILKDGIITNNRTNIDTISISSYYFSIDVNKSFPILESKKVNVKNALSEIMWIYLKQSNDVNWLRERGNNIWNEWAIDEDGIYRIYDPYKKYNDNSYVYLEDLDGNKLDEKVYSLYEDKTIIKAKYYGKEFKNTIGTAYGYINNLYKRPQYVLNSLKNDKNDRRMLISLWQDAHIKTAVLPSCVWSCEWKVRGEHLDLFVHQRSCDVALGLPFNVTQYALLLLMFAKVSNLKPGILSWSIMDAHLYVNQLDGIKEQLKRYKLMNRYEKVIKKGYTSEYYNKLNDYEKNIFDFMKNKKDIIVEIKNKDNFFDYSTDFILDKEYLKNNPSGNKDIIIKNYNPLPFIKMEVAQ